MAGEYTVKILGSEEFNKLPFKRIQDNPDNVFGAADKKNRIAYVRDTGYNDVTKANIGHEFDELMQDVSEHEEDGIRYKDFSQSFGNFGSKIPVIGKLTGGLVKMFGGGIDMLGAGAGKLGLPNFNIGNPSASQAGAVPGPGGRPIVGTPQGPYPAAGSGPTAVGPGGRTIIGAPQMPTPPAGGTGGSFLDNIYGGVKNLFSGSATQPPRQPDMGGGTTVGGFDIGGQLGKALPGAAVAMLGNLFADKVDAPDLGGIRSDLESKIGGAGGPGTEAYNLGMTEARRQLGTEPGTLPDAVLANLYQNRDDEIEALENRFRGAGMGGGMSESDTSRMGTLRTEIVEKYEREEQRLQHEYQQTQEARHMDTMTTMLNLDQAQFNQYAQLAQLDIYELMVQTGIDQQTAMNFKTLFGNIGGRMIDSAFPTRQA